MPHRLRGLQSGVLPGPSQPGLLQSNPPVDTLPGATPAKRKRGKSLSRRTGQDGHIEQSGRWFVVRFWKDIPGQEKRMHVRERVCPISGPGLLSKSERKRKRGKSFKQAEPIPRNISTKSFTQMRADSRSVSNQKLGCNSL